MEIIKQQQQQKRIQFQDLKNRLQNFQFQGNLIFFPVLKNEKLYFFFLTFQVGFLHFKRTGI